MFKLIAIRPLKGCYSSILKCLKEEQFYYFCNEYTITSDGIAIRDKFVRFLPEDFFSLDNNSQLQINVSAVVGMNGDGKSTLVELVMRLLNNCAKHYGITDKDYLLRVEGVKAELYYEIDKVVYCIRERKDDTYTSFMKYADMSDGGLECWEKDIKPEEGLNNLDELFYTIVSNYSHYAYNTNDFRDEWDNNLKVNRGEEKCWLHYLFHKNDGYLAPIAIHPYREEGNIDVNRETALTMQRLMALYIQEPSPKENEKSFRRIGGKDAEILQLTDIGYSKLQQTTLWRFFKDNKSVSSISKVIDLIEENIKKYDDVSVEDLHDNKLEVIELCLDMLMGVKDEAYQNYLDRCLAWFGKRQGVFSSKSDIKRLLDALRKFNTTYKENNIELQYNTFNNKFGKYSRFNIRQLVRLRYVYKVMQCWNYPIEILFNEYAKLTDIERCQHYIIYKTINICATYPDYRNTLDEYDRGWNNVGLVLRDGIISEMVNRIKKDDTHVTLKLRQCLEFINKRDRDNYNVFESLDFEPESKKAKEMHLGNLWVKFDDLKEHYKLDPFPLQLLPPPIYKTDILYKPVNREEDHIPYCFLSSGEKQLLNNFGALIYHLRNLDSVSGRRYKNVNIILEEIELYFHPEYQRQIVKMLLDKIRARSFNHLKRINIMFVTHSPFMLSDIPKCNVLFLKEGKPYNGMQENTFGANIHGLLRNGFFMPSLPVGEFAHEKINDLFGRLNSYRLDPRDREQSEWFYSNIMRVGEPYLREQLMKLYYMHFPVNER